MTPSTKAARTVPNAPKTGAATQSSRVKKDASKPPLPTAERLKRHFSSLCAQIDGGHFNNAIKTCDKILRIEPRDGDTLQTKLFLLLQTEQYSQALSLCEEDGGDHLFEKAYALYRLHRETEGEEALRSLGSKEQRGVLHLHAQLKYRQGDYQTALETYGQLLDSADPDSDEHADLLTNLQAAQQHIDFLQSGYQSLLHTLPINSLEDGPPPLAPSAALQIQASVAAPTITQKPPRKSRVPKGVIPGVTPPPDPERWLKKSERTNIPTRGKGKKTGGGGATQGSVAEPRVTGSGTAKGKKRK